MIDANSKSARAITAAAVLVAAGLHATMSAKFGYSLGATPTEAYLLACFGVTLDICKVFALAFTAHAFDRGRYVKGIACAMIWAVTVIYSGFAALGFAALTRDLQPPIGRDQARQ